ncbi:MAG: HNH endonuclease [Firmicutes bacterium]|jgi:hypothetical protein|nr:HNH endonuclease [Bacillota bacterium]
MPIKRDKRHFYPDNWGEISRSVRERSGWKCEWCGAEARKPHPVTGSVVVLTVAHLDHDPTNNDPENLRALCQLCHNRHDMPIRAWNRKYKPASNQLKLGGQDGS